MGLGPIYKPQNPPPRTGRRTNRIGGRWGDDDNAAATDDADAETVTSDGLKTIPSKTVLLKV